MDDDDQRLLNVREARRARTDKYRQALASNLAGDLAEAIEQDRRNIGLREWRRTNADRDPEALARQLELEATSIRMGLTIGLHAERVLLQADKAGVDRAAIDEARAAALGNASYQRAATRNALSKARKSEAAGVVFEAWRTLRAGLRRL